MRKENNMWWRERESRELTGEFYEMTQWRRRMSKDGSIEEAKAEIRMLQSTIDSMQEQIDRLSVELNRGVDLGEFESRLIDVVNAAQAISEISFRGCDTSGAAFINAVKELDRSRSELAKYVFKLPDDVTDYGDYENKKGEH